MVESTAVNRVVVGPSPTPGANGCGSSTGEQQLCKLKVKGSNPFPSTRVGVPNG